MKKKLILALAVALPAIPTLEWILSGVRDFSAFGDADVPLSLIVVYYPARVFALIGFVLMFYQFLLSARLPILESTYKRADLIKRHRSVGKIGFILILLHGLLMLLSDLVDYGTIAFSAGKLLGIGALFLLIIAVVAAWWFKPLQFTLKTWRRFHIAAFFVFPLAFFHAISIGTVAGQLSATQVIFGVFLAVYLFVAVRKILAVVRGDAGSGARKPQPRPAAKPAPDGSHGPSDDTTEDEKR
ncbi:MAG: hypothetical protein EA426_12570 [Spirochaetaceae bacterium]|nr:MAG: hypothetical protein EA426_12570 [Spirochaetaceae bacterium]